MPKPTRLPTWVVRWDPDRRRGEVIRVRTGAVEGVIIRQEGSHAD